MNQVSNQQLKMFREETGRGGWRERLTWRHLWGVVDCFDGNNESKLSGTMAG